MQTLVKKELITMSNDLSKSVFRVSVNEFRLLLVAMSQMPKFNKNNTEQVDIDPDQPYYITKDDFVRLGVAPNNVAHEIRSACSDLMNRKVFINTPFGLQEINWTDNVLHFKSEKFEELKRKYPTAKYDDEFIQSLRFHNLLDSLPLITNSSDNIVARVVFSKSIIKYISLLEDDFTQLKLEEFAGFNSFYTFRIYILLMRHRDTGWYKARLDDFRQMFDIVDNYKSVGDLKKYVLDVAMKEINDHSDYFASYKLTDKLGRSGKGIKLTNLEIKFKKVKIVDGESENVTSKQPTVNTIVNDEYNPNNYTVGELQAIDKACQEALEREVNKGKKVTARMKANFRKKSRDDGWGLEEYRNEQAQIQKDREFTAQKKEAEAIKLQQDKEKAVQNALENKAFIDLFSSLTEEQKNSVADKVKEDLKGGIFINNFNPLKSHNDIMFRIYYKKALLSLGIVN